MFIGSTLGEFLPIPYGAINIVRDREIDSVCVFVCVCVCLCVFVCVREKEREKG